MYTLNRTHSFTILANAFGKLSLLGFLLFFTVITSGQSCILPGTWSPGAALTGTIAAGSYSGDQQLDGAVTIGTGTTVTFSSADVGVREAITVKDNATLIIDNSLLTTDTTLLWRGIIVEVGGTLEVRNGSEICQAVTAVTAAASSTSDVANFDITGSSFKENITAMRIRKFTDAIHPGILVGSLIEGGTLVSGGVGLNGIFVDNVHHNGTPISGLTIGSSTGAVNKIKDLEVGILATNSTLWVQNTKFENIDQITTALGYAIEAIVNDVAYENAQLLVGTTVAHANTFTACRFGVSADNYEEVIISDNTFKYGTGSGPFARAALVQNTDTLLIIRDNIIKNFTTTAIDIRNNETADASINTNSITTLASGPGLIGISAEVSIGTGPVALAVRDNIISGVQTGIQCMNTEQTEIDRNDITIATVTGTVIGIRMDNTDDAAVEDNTLSSDCSGTPCAVMTYYGINTNNATGVVLASNNVEHFGYGALVNEVSVDGNALCNTFNQCNYGFGFRSIGVTAPYGPVQANWAADEPSDNAWFPKNTAKRTICYGPSPGSDGEKIEWIFRANSGSFPRNSEHNFPDALNDDGGIPATNPLAIIPTGLAEEDVASTEICNGASGMRIGESETLTPMEQAVLDYTISGDPASIAPEIYSHLQLMLLRGSADATALSAMATTNIVALRTIEEWIAQEEFATATASLTAITPTNATEDLHMQMLGVLIRTKQAWKDYLALPDSLITATNVDLADFLSTDDAAFTNTVANLQGYGNGDAVYIACALLNHWPAIPAEAPAKFATQSVSNELLITPNPAVNEVTLSNVLESASHYQIVNLQGQVVQTGQLTTQRISTVQLPAGLYLVNTTDQYGTPVASTKLIIQ